MGTVILLPSTRSAADLAAERRVVSRAAVAELAAHGGRGSTRYHALAARTHDLALRERQMAALEATIAEANGAAAEDRRR